MKNYKIVYGSNMTEIMTPRGSVLFSYQEPVAVTIDGPGPTKFKTAEKFSMTTTKHVNAAGYREAVELGSEEFAEKLKLII